jgi:hypothetical protein
LGQITFTVSSELRGQIEKYQQLKRLENISQATRMLIRIGLEVEKVI